MKTKIPLIKTPQGRTRKRLEFSFFRIVLVLACLALSPAVQAVLPAPDGGYPGGNTAEGQNALFSLTTGRYNTAVGVNALRINTSGGVNTALGYGAGANVTTGSYEVYLGFDVAGRGRSHLYLQC